MDPDGKPCVLLACFLPSREKAYVIEEIFNDLTRALGRVTVFVGIQYGSHPDAEDIIASAASGWTVQMARVGETSHIDSDAAAYVEALRLLRASRTTHSLCYFIHSKGITSDNDEHRHLLLADLLDHGRTTHALSPRGVGSYGPHLTITRSRQDVELMEAWIHRFVPSAPLPALPYFYAHTIWVAKGECVRQFLDVVDPTFFTTPVPEFSDRYFAERDLPHIVDMLAGKRPSYGRLVGNHSTSYQRTRKREFAAKLVWWQVRATPARVRRLARARIAGQPVHVPSEP